MIRFTLGLFLCIACGHQPFGTTLGLVLIAWTLTQPRIGEIKHEME